MEDPLRSYRSNINVRGWIYDIKQKRNEKKKQKKQKKKNKKTKKKCGKAADVGNAKSIEPG